MPRALVDTTVLFAAAYSRDGAHDEGLEILHGIDTAGLPEAVVLDYVLAETLNGLTTHAGHESAVDFLDRLEENTRFHIDSLTADTLATAKALFRQYERFSFVDACIVAYRGCHRKRHTRRRRMLELCLRAPASCKRRLLSTSSSM